jgi:hypothetical protein
VARSFNYIGAYLLAGWSGFFVMSYELLGGRVLASDFGSSVSVWGALITVFMIALAIGYLIGGTLSTRRASFRDLGAILVLQAVTTVLSLAVSESVLDWIFAHIEDVRYGALSASMMLFFVPTVVSGMVSPYAVRLLVTDVRESGRYAGKLLFVSTFGSAAGTIATSFYFVLYFEVNEIVYGLTAISIVLGIAAMARKPSMAA